MIMDKESVNSSQSCSLQSNVFGKEMSWLLLVIVTLIRLPRLGSGQPT